MNEMQQIMKCRTSVVQHRRPAGGARPASQYRHVSL